MPQRIGGARDAEIAQAAFDEGEYFIAAGFRLNEVGILFVEIEQDVLERGELEEIVRFRDGFRRPSAIGAGLSRLHVNVRVVVNAVLAAVVTGIDVAVFAAEFEQAIGPCARGGLPWCG